MPLHAPQQGVLVRGREDPPETAHAIPLTGVEVQARITGSTARVSVVQHYRNDARTPVEAAYVFPLEEGSAVCGFRVRIDGTLLEGRVEGRDQAFDEYDDALADGRTALLLDQERPDIFTASVGNLLPGQELAVEIEYVAEVPREGGGLRWRLPTTVSPRYVPKSQRDAEGMDDAERINPPVTDRPLPYCLTLVVEVDLGTPLRSVESPSHKTRVALDGSRARIELAGDEGLMDRDFVLRLHPQDPVAPVSGIEAGPDGRRYVGVSFLPEFEREREPVEVVFMVDCSGSMQGDSIEQARKTLRLCLRSLERGDRFNLIRFGSRYESYAEESVAYDDASLERADAYVARMQADLGGTELLQPLGAAYRRPPLEGLSRRLVLITDGQVANEEALIALAREHAREVAVFAFGVGHGASEYLVQGLARAGRGAAEMVYPGEGIDEKVLRHFHRMTGRALPQVRLDWEGLEVEDVLPRGMPPVWAGEPVSFYGRLREGTQGRAVLTVTVDGEAHRFVAVLDARHAGPVTTNGARGAIPLRWARRRIRELEEEPLEREGRGSQRADRTHARRRHRKETAEAELLAFGRTFGLVSSATSYVLVDTRPGAPRAATRARFVRVPGPWTRGGHGHPAMALHSAWYGPSRAPLRAPGLASVSGLEHALRPDLVSRMVVSGMLDHPAGAPSSTPEDLLALQLSVDGSWRPSPEAEQVTGISMDRIRELAEGLEVPEAEALVVTLAVLVTLEARHPEAPALWRPLLRKARNWVERTVAGGSPPSEADWEAWMQTQLGL